MHLRRDRRAFAREQAEAQAEEGPPPERRERRSLSHVGGRVELRGGDEGLGAALAAALDVPREDDSSREHVHGFHSYAARLHPLTARRLVERLSAKGEVVFDPFMGSGTVLVEARLLERRASGTDLNPLSVELAHLKTRGTTELERRMLVEAGRRAAEYADERRLNKSGPTTRYGKEDLELFDVHMLLELDGIKAGVSLEPDGFAKEALKLVFSSILVKVSRQPGDTVERVASRRLASGFAIRLFSAKTEELAERLGQFAALLPADAPACRVDVDDARVLSSVRDASVESRRHLAAVSGGLRLCPSSRSPTSLAWPRRSHVRTPRDRRATAAPSHGARPRHSRVGSGLHRELARDPPNPGAGWSGRAHPGGFRGATRTLVCGRRLATSSARRRARDRRLRVAKKATFSRTESRRVQTPSAPGTRVRPDESGLTGLDRRDAIGPEPPRAAPRRE